MNAALELVAELDDATVARIARAVHGRHLSASARRPLLSDHFAFDLASLLNALARRELDTALSLRRLPAASSLGAARAALWRWGASREDPHGDGRAAGIQPTPSLLREKLVFVGAVRGPSSPVGDKPVAVPARASAERFEEEPETLEELCARATSVIGVRLGDRGRDKGAWGTRVAALLGVPERGFAEPDWRGEVEIKTVPVKRDRHGYWKVTEDPAIGMEHHWPYDKLGAVLWLARVADGPEPTVVAWCLIERDDTVDRWLSRDLHTRPKGGKGATTRGWYLHKRFFADCGLVRILNGLSPEIW